MKVFLHDEIHPLAEKLLREKVEVIDDLARISEADAILVRKIQLPTEILQKAKNVKVIGFHGSGMNGIDTEEAKKRGIELFAVPGMNAQSVAETNIALALDVSHMITQSACDIKKGKSMKDGLHKFKGREISGKTAGIIGMGAIGTLTAQMLKNCFGMQIIGYSRSFHEEKADKIGAKAADNIYSLLAESDIVFLALPYTPETENLMGDKEFGSMKESAIFINTARGKLVDEDALYRALAEKKISGAACDVCRKEPIEADNPLIQLDNFIATPHIGGNTEEALYRVGMGVVNGILERLEVAYEKDNI